MSINKIIFNPYEKEVLVHTLYQDEPKFKKVMDDLIEIFEQTNFYQTIMVGKKSFKAIDFFLKDKEYRYPALKSFYKNNFGLQLNQAKRNLLEAGIFYTIGKLLLMNYFYNKGMNKIMYAASLPDLPDSFTPLYLFRLGGINLEQGMIVEAGNVLELAIQCCRRYRPDSTMRKLEELILYQIFRVFIILENFADAQKIKKVIEELLEGKESIIFSSLKGYYYRNIRELDTALEVLDQSYTRYKSDETIKTTFSRHWFNIIYQRAFCYLIKKDFEHAQALIDEAIATLDKVDYRNRGYCQNLMGNIEMVSRNGDYSRALKCFLESYDNFERYNDYRNMARVKRNIGQTCFELKKYPETIQAYNQSLAYDYRIQTDISIIRTLLQKIDLRIELIQYYKAKEYFERIDEKIKNIQLPRNHPLWKEIKKRKKTLAKQDIPHDEFIGNSKIIRDIKKEIKRWASQDVPVLILGERGVGKTFIAKIIHDQSGRKGRFEKINCAAIPGELLESELFGHEKGAFTHAFQKRVGRLEMADGGTVFLDEVGELPPHLQAKLLQFLGEGTIFPVGAKEDKKLDTRVICATNKNLNEELGKSFRYDFYDRISGLMIHIPPLRERHEDIITLANHFYILNCQEQKKSILGIETDALSYIENYYWPGNVRELQKTIFRCVHRLDEDRPISRDSILKALDPYNKMFEEKKKTKEQDKETTGMMDQSAVQQEIVDIKQRLAILEGTDPDQVTAIRITDSMKMLNNLFHLIKQYGPIRKSDILKHSSSFEGSFHYWIRQLRDEYKVIKEQKKSNHSLYKIVSERALEKKEKQGLLRREKDSSYTLKEKITDGSRSTS